MMRPMPCRERCNGIESVLSGRTLSMKTTPDLPMESQVPKGPPAGGRSSSRRAGFKLIQINLAKRNRRAPLPGGGGRSNLDDRRSAVAEPVGGVLPLRDIVGDHPRRFHRGLAELRVARDFALNALAFGVQQVAQAFEFGNQFLDFRK